MTWGWGGMFVSLLFLLIITLIIYLKGRKGVRSQNLT